MDNQYLVRGWALQERSTGHKLIDDLAVIKLLMSKAAVQNWDKIEVQIHNKQTLNLIRLRKSQDMSSATLLEDIHSLKSLFRMCSFYLVNRDLNHINNRISAYALDIIQNEELWIPQ